MERWGAPSRGVKGAGSTGEDIWLFKKKEGVSVGRGGQACGPGGRFESPSRGAQAKPEFTLQGVAGGPGGLSTGKAGMRASVAW